ncbi:HD domain-containing protein [Gramella sp. MAR_2010_147]|uniref:HD domain-containing protein n=1 Tax=Gramella sp. MAR_2010_147 TaxID=1250205 RepID=UPI00087AA56A|nr:HD domain-containing protein [Gramella sp. MAR_2010_147]SDS63136.1 Predicted metal-dependent phosphohydrolase, HD superfamily [Gramella sp. MAR_2010_147]
MSKSDIFNIVHKRLENDLPHYLTYHDADHTKSVIERSIFLAEKERLIESDIELIKVAALYHDAGFMLGRENHEEKSCKLATKELPDFNFSKEQIKTICGMINATRIPQKTHNIYEDIVADADLFYLGTHTYEYYSNKLFQELRHFQPKITEKDWLKIQLDFLQSHKFHTKYGIEILAPVKKTHLMKLVKKWTKLVE